LSAKEDAEMANARERARREGMVCMKDSGYQGLTKDKSKQTGAENS
jgi:hypothetical protein